MASKWMTNQLRPDFDWNQFYEYNARDSANTLEICQAMKPLIAARGVEETFTSEMALCYPLLTIEALGMAVDVDQMQELCAEYQVEIDKWKLFLSCLVGPDLNLGSPAQLNEYLYSQLKLPKRVKDGKLTSDEDALLSLMPMQPMLIKSILELRSISKAQAFTKIKLGDDGRIRTTFKPAGTVTGRLSSSKSITGSGFNLQTIPKKLRKFFISDPDYVLIQVDYAKAESWIVAYLAQDEKMIAALNDADFHSTNASNILGKPVTKDDYIDRQLGKKISHASNYGVTEFQMQLDLAKEGYSFSKAQCKDLIEMYFSCYPKIRSNYHGWIQECLRRDRTLVTPFGRKVTFFDLWSNRLMNMSYAFIPQSTVGDLTNRALIRVYETIKELQILLQVHDSLVMQVRRSKFTPELLTKIEECMAVPVTIKGHTITIPIDLEVGFNWYDLVDPSDMFSLLKELPEGLTHTDRMLHFKDFMKKQKSTKLKAKMSKLHCLDSKWQEMNKELIKLLK